MKHIKSLILLSMIALVFGCKTENNDKKIAYAIETNQDDNGFNYETVANDPTGLRLYTLENGLKVYLGKNDEASGGIFDMDAGAPSAARPDADCG